MKTPLIALLLVASTLVVLTPTAAAHHCCNFPFVGGVADSGCETVYHAVNGSDGSVLTNIATCIALGWCE